MNAKVAKLAQAILRLQSEYTDEEILDALRLLEQSSKGAIRDILKMRAVPRRVSRTPLSQELNLIREQDPEVFALIESFRRKLEDGELLPSLNDLRAFGFSLDKGFKPGKSRAETVPRIVRLLLRISRSDLRKIIHAVPTIQSGGSEAFLRLADGIIRGTARQEQ